jgi:sterol 14-demethylase
MTSAHDAPDLDSRPLPGNAAPRLSGGLPFLGHLLEMRKAPISLFRRVRSECGEVGEINLAGTHVTLLSGAEAQEAFFRASDEQLDQGAAYPFMKPIFGPGVVFDLPLEARRRTLRTQALRDKHMRGHAEVIARETDRMCDQLQDSGEIDLLEFFGELTTYTSTATLIGQEFRDDLAVRGREFTAAFHHLERGTDALAYVNPSLPLPSFRARDRARATLVDLIGEILDRRESEERRCGDLLQVMDSLVDEYGKRRYSRSEITGMIIGMMFAGHHTSQGVASWALIELLRRPEILSETVEELDGLYADGREVSFQSLREIPRLEGVLKETLRLHPPLIILMRKVVHDFHYRGWTVRAGDLVAISPAVSNRLEEHFAEPDAFEPDRYSSDRREDARNPWAWIPFGGGRHKCVGSAFAIMQLKVIFSIVLRRLDFSLAQPDDSYVDNHTKMVVHLKQPCRVRYRKRSAAEASGGRLEATRALLEEEADLRPFRIAVDEDLCQGHAVCMGEAPELFALGEDEKVSVLEENPRKDLRKKAERAVRYCPNRVLRIEES